MNTRLRRVQGKRHGYTLVEALVVLLIVSVLLSGVAGLLYSSWQWYQTALMQNRVNAEARRALDAICEDLRTSGVPSDAIDNPSSLAQVRNSGNSASSGQQITFSIPQYTVQYRKSRSGQILLRTQFPGSFYEIAEFIQSVQFEYEFRVPRGDGTWYFYHTSNLYAVDGAGNPYNVAGRLATVFVQVTAGFQSTDGTPYRRTLQSAVHLRGPYNKAVP